MSLKMKDTRKKFKNVVNFTLLKIEKICILVFLNLLDRFKKIFHQENAMLPLSDVYILMRENETAKTV